MILELGAVILSNILSSNQRIKTENPDRSDDQMAFSIAELKEHGVVDSGDTLNLGIGEMTDARWKDFFDKMVKIGMVDSGTDYKKAQGSGAQPPSSVIASRRSAMSRTLIIICLAIVAVGLLWSWIGWLGRGRLL